MFDVCVLGHLTKDIIKIDGRVKEMPGGTAYYLPITFKRFGGNISVVTKINRNDAYLLTNLIRENIPIFLGKSHKTTVFINVYTHKNKRDQWVKTIADPFTIENVKDVQSKIFHLGPLTKDDIPLSVLRFLAKKAKISLDVQGYLRNIDKPTGKVTLTDWSEKEDYLSYVNILKTDEEEAKILSKKENLKEIALTLSRYGPEEVIITRGWKHSLIYSRNKFYFIPSYTPKLFLDPTGCGDTYMAGYLFLKCKTNDLQKIGTFSAKIASLKLENYGPPEKAKIQKKIII
jgi:sugar/nucleoside kinase (ribokinase family)